MADRIQIRRDTASDWTSVNPTLTSGELGLETDTGKLKVGDGSTAWTSLGYYFAGYNFAPLASPTFTGTVTGPTINASTALQIGGTAITSTAAELNILDGVTSTTAELNILDGVTSTTAELNILDGVTSTPAELNILDGVTSTTAELNILDGVTATAAELNYVDGVTSAIQTQIDTKGTVSSLLDLSVTSTAAELNILDGVTSTAAELNILDGVTSTAAELNILDGVTSTAAELNKLDALSRGSILYGNASGATTVLTKGTSDQVLTSDGTDIAWAAAGGGGGSGWTYLSTITANATQIDYTGFSSTYDDYMIVMTDINGSYTGHDFYCYFKMGSVWHAEGTGTNSTSECYHWNQLYTALESSVSAVSAGGTVASPSTRISPTSSGPMSNTAGQGWNAIIYLADVNGDQQKGLYCHSVGVNPYSGRGHVTHAMIKTRSSPSVVATNAITGIRFKLSNGTITGTFKFYGLAKS